MANQPIVCMNVLCELFKEEQWNSSFIDNGENAPWDNYLCPKCGRRTEPYWIIKYHYELPGMKELEDNILEFNIKIQKLKAERDFLYRGEE